MSRCWLLQRAVRARIAAWAALSMLGPPVLDGVNVIPKRFLFRFRFRFGWGFVLDWQRGACLPGFPDGVGVDAASDAKLHRVEWGQEDPGLCCVFGLVEDSRVVGGPEGVDHPLAVQLFDEFDADQVGEIPKVARSG